MCIWSWGFIVWSDCVLVYVRNTEVQPSEPSDDHPLGSVICFDFVLFTANKIIFLLMEEW
jgi:hypothetical protein